MSGGKGVPRIRLEVVSGPAQGQAFDLEDGVHTVGSGAVATYVVADPEVARRHLMLRVNHRGAALVDMRASGGILLNGARLSAAAEARLQDGDRIVIGGTELHVHAVGADGAGGVAPRARASATAAGPDAVAPTAAPVASPAPARRKAAPAAVEPAPTATAAAPAAPAPAAPAAAAAAPVAAPAAPERGAAAAAPERGAAAREVPAPGRAARDRRARRDAARKDKDEDAEATAAPGDRDPSLPPPRPFGNDWCAYLLANFFRKRPDMEFDWTLLAQARTHGFYYGDGARVRKVPLDYRPVYVLYMLPFFPQLPAGAWPPTDKDGRLDDPGPHPQPEYLDDGFEVGVMFNYPGEYYSYVAWRGDRPYVPGEPFTIPMRSGR